MKTGNHLEVHWPDGSVVGHLANRGTIYFIYDEGWLKRGHNLSPISLPFEAAGFNGDRGIDGLPGLIADCLPDTWGRKIAAKEFSRNQWGEPNTMELLAWRGSRGVGALQFKPALTNGGRPSNQKLEAINLAALARGAVEIERGDPSEVLPQLARGGTAGGAYPKALILVYPDGSIGVGEPDGQAEACLVKFDMPGREGVAPCEDAYAKMAAAAGIRAVNTRLIPEGDRRHLLVRRFDVPQSGSPIQKRHFHSLSGLLHKEAGALDYRDAFRALMRLGLPLGELQELSRRMVFNVLTSNADDHGKNHALLYDDQRKNWSLTPAYDMTYSASMLERGMTVSGEVWPSVKTMQELSVEAGLKREEFDQVLDQVSVAVSQWTQFAKECEVPAALARSVQERIVRIRQSVEPVKVGLQNIAELPVVGKKSRGGPIHER